MPLIYQELSILNDTLPGIELDRKGWACIAQMSRKEYIA